MTLHTTLSEQLAYAYITTRLDEAEAHRTSRRARRGRIRRRTSSDAYTDYLTSRGTIR